MFTYNKEMRGLFRVLIITNDKSKSYTKTDSDLVLPLYGKTVSQFLVQMVDMVLIDEEFDIDKKDIEIWAKKSKVILKVINTKTTVDEHITRHFY